MIVAGIDVRAKTVTVVIRRSERSGQPREFKNTPQGQAAVVNALRNASVTHAGLEATGRYRRALALALDNAKLQVLVVNPKVAQRLVEARSSRPKTDAVEARCWPNWFNAGPSNHRRIRTTRRWRSAPGHAGLRP